MFAVNLNREMRSYEHQIPHQSSLHHWHALPTHDVKHGNQLIGGITMNSLSITLRPSKIVECSNLSALCVNELFTNTAYVCKDGVVTHLELEYEEGDTNEGKS